MIISADGWLHRVPWAALPGTEKRFLVEELAFSSVASSRSLVRNLRRPAMDAGGWLVVGGVDYGAAPTATTSSQPWQPLANSGSEAVGIAELLSKRFPDQSERTLLLGGDAAKEAIVSSMANRRFMHFATHGSFADRQTDAFDIHGLAAQLDSFLVFAGANLADPPSAAYLSAEEIGELDLRATDVVTMSACETALGHAQAGQGLIGLVAALDRAGVRATVSALWKVDDEATARFMQSFYASLLRQKGLAPHVALREAQLDLIDHSQGQYEHPFYWAAWSNHGAPSAPELL